MLQLLRRSYPRTFEEVDPAMPHWLMKFNLPNLFSIGLVQVGVGPNQSQQLYFQSRQTAHIIGEPEQKSVASERSSLNLSRT